MVKPQDAAKMTRDGYLTEGGHLLCRSPLSQECNEMEKADCRKSGKEVKLIQRLMLVLAVCERTSD